MNAPAPSVTTVGPPMWLLAELAYRCPLHCVFCCNPVNSPATRMNCSTADWLRVLREGRELGAVQCGFSGGEPLLRDDLEILIAEARRLGYYQPHHLRRRPRRRPGWTPYKAARARPHPAVLPGLCPRDQRLPHPHPRLRAQAAGGEMIKARGWPMVMKTSSSTAST